jgi:hypothetical protein
MLCHMKPCIPTILSFAIVVGGCASINPFEYTARNILEGPYPSVCWGKVGAADPANPCDDKQAEVSLKECVVELEHSASLYTVEEEKREMLFECMFEKGWQEIHLVDWPSATLRNNHPSRPTC